MAYNVIYFEKVVPETQSIINNFKEQEMKISFWSNLTDAEKEETLLQANYLIAASYPITRELLEKAPNVKLIQKTGSGTDNIDLNAAADLGIKVATTIGANASSVVEMTIGLIIGLYRKLNLLDRLTKSGEWRMWEYRPSMFEMKNKTHGIIGIGHIGKKVAELSQAFGTNVLYYDVNRLAPEEERQRSLTYSPFEELLAQSDIISLHIPLMPSTENLISEKELKLLKPTAVLVNVARGKIIDEKALANALENQQLLGAGIDTWANEPIEAGNPLLAFDNVLATPHVAGGTRDALEKVMGLSFENIRMVEKGMEPNNSIKLSAV